MVRPLNLEGALGPPMAPQGAPGTKKIEIIFFEKMVFFFFDFFDVGQLFRYKRYFNTIIGCWDLSRSIELNLLYILT